MYCNKRISRGVKRKLAESVEEEAGEVRQNSAYQPQNNVKSNEVILRNCLTSTSTTSSSSSSISGHYSSYNRNHQNPMHSNHPSCTDMRGIIFNISMGKLSKYRQSPDPRLVRSVLICNTLKRLEKELEKEGLKINFGPSGVSFFSPVMNAQNITLDPPPNASQPLPNLVNNLYVNESNYCGVPTEKPDEDDSETEKYLLDLDSNNSGRVTPFLRSSTECLYEKESSSELPSNGSSVSPSPSSSTLWNMEDSTDRLSSLNWSSVLNFNASSSSSSIETDKEELLTSSSLPENIRSESTEKYVSGESSPEKSVVTSLNGNAAATGSTSLHTLMPPTTISETANSVSHLINHHHHLHHHLMSSAPSSSYSAGSSNDEIFGDIDLSLYDFDLISPLSPPNVKLAPVSAEELIQSVSSDSDGSSSSSSSSSSQLSSSSLSPSPPPALQLYSSHSLVTSTSSTSSSTPTSCGSSVTSTSAFQAHYFKSKDKMFMDEMSTVMS